MEDTIKVCEIDWETDGEKVDLPEDVTIDISELDSYSLENEEQVNEAICDHLSDIFGYLVGGYTRTEWKY